MNTLVLLKKEINGEVHCSALCLQHDYDKLFDSRKIGDDYETLSESEARVLYPSAYARYIKKDLAHCVSIWLERFYEGRKEISLDEDTVFTQSYLVAICKGIIKISFYVGCDVVEATEMILYLREKVGDIVEIEVSTTTLFANFSEN